MKTAIAASLGLGLLCLGVPARGETILGLDAAIERIRHGGAEGRAMADYIRRYPVPLSYAPMEERRGGHYVSRTRVSDGRIIDEARIQLNENLRRAPVESLAVVLHHEYIHRLEDLAGEDLSGNRSHTRGSYEAAMRYLREKLNPAHRGAFEAPLEVSAAFAAEGESAAAEAGDDGLVAFLPGAEPVAPRAPAQRAQLRLVTFNTAGPGRNVASLGDTSVSWGSRTTSLSVGLLRAERR